MARCRVRGSVHYTYDTLDRLTELRYNTGTGTAAYRYIYDDLNQLVRINDVAGGKTYTYLYLRQPREPAAEERVRAVNGRAGDSDADSGLRLRQRGLAGSADELQRQRNYL